MVPSKLRFNLQLDGQQVDPSSICLGDDLHHPAGNPFVLTDEPNRSGNIDGNPNLTDASPTGYYLWHNHDGLHLRTHDPGAEHNFTGRLATNGVFQDVGGIRLESNDKYDVLDGGHILVLHLHTYGVTDGLDLHVMGGTNLRLNLHLDGKPIATSSIFLGDDARHPASNPFELTR